MSSSICCLLKFIQYRKIFEKFVRNFYEQVYLNIYQLIKELQEQNFIIKKKRFSDVLDRN